MSKLENLEKVCEKEIFYELIDSLISPLISAYLASKFTLDGNPPLMISNTYL